MSEACDGLLDQQNLRQILRDQRLPPRYAHEVEILLAQGAPSREVALQIVVGREFLDHRARRAEKGKRRAQRRALNTQQVAP